MKTGVLAAILISTAIIAHAQKKVTEGSVTYKTDYSLTPEQSAMAAMLPAEQTLKFNGTVFKIVVEQPPATITIIRDVTAKAGVMLIDVPIAQMQIAVKQTKEELDKEKAGDPKFSDFKATGEKQMVGGYNAEKYTYKDDKGGNYELWTTTEIELPKSLGGEEFKEVPGTLVKFTRYSRGVKVTSTLKAVKEEKIGALSIAVPSGYELKTMEEVMAMQGGGE